MKHILRLLMLFTMLSGIVLADAVNFNLNGKTSSLEGFLDRGVLFISPKNFLPALGASVLGIEPNLVTIRVCDKVFQLSFVIRDAAPYLDAVRTAKTLGFQASQIDNNLTITGIIDCKPQSPRL